MMFNGRGNRSIYCRDLHGKWQVGSGGLCLGLRFSFGMVSCIAVASWEVGLMLMERLFTSLAARSIIPWG